jgi:hypothetical protein
MTERQATTKPTIAKGAVIQIGSEPLLAFRL